MRELIDYLKELRRLSFEEPIGGEACDGGDRSSEFVVQRTNDRTVRKIGIYELTRNRKDKAGLKRRVERGKKVFEGKTAVSPRATWGLSPVTGKIDPFQKGAKLIPADAQG